MSEGIDEAAARWHLRQADDDMDWDGFTLWLEADPRHRTAYEAIALLDERIDRARPILATTESEADREPRRRGWLVGWGAAAAGIAAVVAVTMGQFSSAPPTAPQQVAYAAVPGKVRNLQLADGVMASIAPGSVLHASSRDTPVLLEGTAFFDVRHDDAHPLVIRAGDYEIRDVGTRFEVMSGSGMLRVAVTDGRVAVRAPKGSGETEVAAGQVLTIGADGASQVRPSRDTAVASWRRGTLIYDQVPLGLVAADISRYGGRPIEVDPGVARRRFSGVIAPGDREAMATALAELTGLHARTDGDAIRLGDGTGR
jgi:transmembrane sensor